MGETSRAFAKKKEGRVRNSEWDNPSIWSKKKKVGLDKVGEQPVDLRIEKRRE